MFNANGKIQVHQQLDGSTDQILILPGGAIVGTANPASQVAMTPLTDNSGGVVSTTLAAIAAGGAYSQADATAIKNALASIAANQNAIIAALRNVGILP